MNAFDASSAPSVRNLNAPPLDPPPNMSLNIFEMPVPMLEKDLVSSCSTFCPAWWAPREALFGMIVLNSLSMSSDVKRMRLLPRHRFCAWPTPLRMSCSMAVLNPLE